MLSTDRLLQQILAGLVGSVACAVVANLVFGGFFPGPNGMGHDYAGGFPALLAEYYWSLTNGIWAAPWFTPAFCGGIPLFADPGSGYYSIPSIISRGLVLDPLTSFHITFLAFVATGFLGAYLFALRGLKTSLAAAVVAATLFGLNGFFAYRFIIGHTGFHGVMLVPWLALVVCGWESPALRTRWLIELGRVVSAALILTYWVHSGASSLLVPFVLATAALVLLQWMRDGVVGAAIGRSVAASVLAMMLSASKLTAASAYMSNFPRSDYKLPGVGSLLEAGQLAFLMLFANLSDIAGIAAARWQNIQWALDRHELEYGVTVVPLVLGVLAAGSILSQRKGFPWRSPKKIVAGVSLLAIVTAVLLLNVYSPAWNDFLKSLPLIGSSSSMVRWFVVFVPIVAIASAPALDAIVGSERNRILLSATAIVVAVAQVASVNKDFYSAQSYDPKPVTEAFERARDTPGYMPSIRFIAAYVDGNGNVTMPGNRNDVITQDMSQLACYTPIFGYRLEHFPFKTLRPGPVNGLTGDYLNLKNPACFVFPEENSCKPGDHFTVAQRDSAEKFVNYRAFPFERSRAQHVADNLTKVTLALCLFALFGSGLYLLRGFGRSRTNP